MVVHGARDEARVALARLLFLTPTNFCHRRPPHGPYAAACEMHLREARRHSGHTERNDSRPRLLTTQAGDVELRIPTLRKGSFFPSIIEPGRRIDQALYAVVMEAYVNGVSTRSVDDLVGALGADSGIKKSEVTRICAGLDDVVGAFRGRRLDHTEFPYVYLDAAYLHVRNQVSQVCSMAVAIATGITATGERECPRPRRGGQCADEVTSFADQR